MAATLIAQVLAEPQRLELRTPQDRWLATLTHGAQTVISAGPRRTFSEDQARVMHTTWVRVLPAPFDGTIDRAWLRRALAANTQREPDLLALGMQYLRDARALHEAGLQIAGDARYGPLVDGKRQEGSDFNDYLGVPWTYADGSVDRVRKEPFGLSLSEPLASGMKAPFDRLRAIGNTSSAWPFDKLRANGDGELTVVNSRSGPQAEARFMRRGSRAARWSN